MYQVSRAVVDMSTKKVLNDTVKSKLDLLYPNTESILTCKPQITMKSGRVVTLDELEDGIKKSVPFCTERAMDIVVDPDISYETVENVSKILSKTVCAEDHGGVRIIKISSFPQVMFQHAKVDTASSGDDKRCKLKPPCFKIEVPACLPNTMQSINTGYVLDIGQEMESFKIIDKKIIKSSQKCLQKDFVIIPQILSKDRSIVPQLNARDPSDSGPFIVNLLNRNGSACTVFVYLYAYRTRLPHALLRFEGSNDNEVSVLKSKDTRQGRRLYNFSTKVLFDSGTVSDDRQKLTFSCFDGTKADHSTPIAKKIIMDNMCVFFATRKREWCDPNLFTVSGMFKPNNKGFYIPPKIAKDSRFNKNTHSCVFIDSRIGLFSINGEFNSSYSLMNGFMFNMRNYRELKKARSAMIRHMYSLRSGCISLNRYKMPDIDRSALMRIFDYGILLSTDQEFMDNYYSIRDNEAKLFECSNSMFKSTISSRLYTKMLMLIERFVTDNDDETTVTIVANDEPIGTKKDRDDCNDQAAVVDDPDNDTHGIKRSVDTINENDCSQTNVAPSDNNNDCKKLKV